MSQPCPPLYPDRWLDLYRSHDYEQLSDAFLAILDHFREQTYFRLDDSSQYWAPRLMEVGKNSSLKKSHSETEIDFLYSCGGCYHTIS